MDYSTLFLLYHHLVRLPFSFLFTVPSRYLPYSTFPRLPLLAHNIILTNRSHEINFQLVPTT